MGCKTCVNLKIQVQWADTDVYKIARALNRCADSKRAKHMEQLAGAKATRQRARDALFLHEVDCGSTPIGGIDETA